MVITRNATTSTALRNYVSFAQLTGISKQWVRSPSQHTEYSQNITDRFVGPVIQNELFNHSSSCTHYKDDSLVTTFFFTYAHTSTITNLQQSTDSHNSWPVHLCDKLQIVKLLWLLLLSQNTRTRNIEFADTSFFQRETRLMFWLLPDTRIVCHLLRREVANSVTAIWSLRSTIFRDIYTSFDFILKNNVWILLMIRKLC